MNNIYSYLSVDPPKVKGVILTSYTNVTLISTKRTIAYIGREIQNTHFRGKNDGEYKKDFRLDATREELAVMSYVPAHNPSFKKRRHR